MEIFFSIFIIEKNIRNAQSIHIDPWNRHVYNHKIPYDI